MRGHATTAIVMSLMLLSFGMAAETGAGLGTEATRRGYVVFEYTIMKNLPASYVPTAEELAKKISCTLARNEYESVQFGVHALADDIKDIEVNVESDLKGTIYHRIRPADKEALALLREAGNDGEIAGWMQPEVNLQRGNVFPELGKDKSVNFWLTFHADEETKAGLHRGKIRIKPFGKPATVLDLEVKVRPFKLERPRIAFGIWLREDMLPKRLGGLATPSETVLRIYRDMAEHGHNSTWFYPAGSFSQLPPAHSQAFDKLIPLAQEAGLLDPDVPSLLLANTPVDLPTEEQRQTAVTWLEAEIRKRGLPEMIAFGPDEPSYPRDDVEIKTFLKRSHNLSMRVNLDLGGTAAYGFGGDMCDVFTVHDGMISPEMVAESGRTGTELWTYSYRIWREAFDPVPQRYFAGLYTWTHKLNGNWMWAYHHGHHRHAWFAPGSHEPMPVTGYETRREGIDDYRYLQMVEDCITANPDKPAAQQAASWLNDLRNRLATTAPVQVTGGKPLTIAEYDAVREKAAGYIEKLGPVPNESIVRPPVTHARDEAAPYRGKSIQACVAGLKSTDVSKRRAAAWALYELGPEAAAAVNPLARLLDDPEVCIPALHALEAIGSESFRAVATIAKLLEHPDFYVRTGAVLTLGEIGCPMDKRQRGGRRIPSPHASVVAEPLVTALRDDHDAVVSLAGEMLCVMGRLARPALPQAIRMLDSASPGRHRAALRVIAGLDMDAAQAVPKLIALHRDKPGDVRYINALAAIGPPASAAVSALEEYAASLKPGPAQATACYALFLIRGETADLKAMMRLLTDAEGSADTKNHVVKLLNQLGAKAKPVAAEVRRMLESGKFLAQEKELQSFLEKVEKGEVPGVPLVF